jgi:hypothetical protein
LLDNLEVDQILNLWSQSDCEETVAIAKSIQDEKAKSPSDIASILLMIKNQADRQKHWEKKIYRTSSNPYGSKVKEKVPKGLKRKQSDQGHAPPKKQKTHNIYCKWCFKLKGVKYFGHLADDCFNKPQVSKENPSTSKPKKQVKVIADSGASESLVKLQDAEMTDLVDFLESDSNEWDSSFPGKEPRLNKSGKKYPHHLLASSKTKNKNLPLIRVFQGFNGSTQKGLRGGEISQTHYQFLIHIV